jgi:hypothetical protein
MTLKAVRACSGFIEGRWHQADRIACLHHRFIQPPLPPAPFCLVPLLSPPPPECLAGMPGTRSLSAVRQWVWTPLKSTSAAHMACLNARWAWYEWGGQGFTGDCH